MSNNPQLLFAAGLNGAGKSTFSKDLSETGAIIFDVDKVIAQIEAQKPGILKKTGVSESDKRIFQPGYQSHRKTSTFNFRDQFQR